MLTARPRGPCSRARTHTHTRAKMHTYPPRFTQTHSCTQSHNIHTQTHAHIFTHTFTDTQRHTSAYSHTNVHAHTCSPTHLTRGCAHNTRACTHIHSRVPSNHTQEHTNVRKCRCAHSGTLACTCAQVGRHADTHVFHTCGGDRNTCRRAQEYMTPAQTRAPMHKNAGTSMRRCPDKEADVLRESPTGTHTAAHPCTRSAHAFTQPLTSTPFDSSVLELFVQVLCSDLRGTRGGPRRGWGGDPSSREKLCWGSHGLGMGPEVLPGGLTP